MHYRLLMGKLGLIW